MKIIDNGEVFKIEGSNVALARPSHISPAEWANLSVEWKLNMLSLACEVFNTILTND
jgi:hypothetical protein